jgi:hypothetical protein
MTVSGAAHQPVVLRRVTAVGGRHRRRATTRVPGVLTGRVRTRFGRFDPLVLLTCLVAAAVYVAHGFEGVLSRDLGVYAYAGQQVADGLPPYVGILNRAGPLAHLVPGIGVAASRAVGVDDLTGVRVFFLLLSVAAVGLAYVLARDLFRSRLAGLACAAALLSFEGFLRYATYGPREKTTMVLLLLCALLALAHRRWATTGCFVALATLTWQPVFFAAAAGAVSAALLLPTGRARALLRIAVGGAVPTVLTVGAFAAIGELRTFLDDFLLINAQYTRQASLLDHRGKTWDILREAYGWSLWVFAAGCVVLLALTVLALTRRPSARDERDPAVVGAGVALAVGLLWSLYAFNSWPDAFLLLPLAALGVGGAAAWLRTRTTTRVAAAVVATWVAAAAAASSAYAIGTSDDTLDQQRHDVAFVMGLLPDDATMLSVDAPQALVLAGQRNPSRFQVFSGGLTDYLDHTWPGGRQGYGRWVAGQAPTVIAVGGTGSPGWLDPLLAESYQRVGRSPGWTWYLRDTVPLPVRLAVREELGSPPGPVAFASSA